MRFWRSSIRPGLHAKCLNQRGEGSRLLPSARIVKKEAWKGLTPALEHTNERPALQMRRYAFIRYKSETDAAQRGLHDEDLIVDNQRAAYRD